MALRAGVLIIGSLLWDENRKRPQWRETRLNQAAAKYVRVPIRYGRFSSERQAYTMVFSRFCYSHKQLGQGVIVPFARPIESFDCLREEAEFLAVAEGLRDKSTWGAVGLLYRERSKLPPSFLQQWTKYFVARFTHYKSFAGHKTSEAAAISRRGFMNLKWPLGNKETEQYDLLLATPTKAEIRGQPHAKRYPLPAEIASLVIADETHYFINNVLCGIRTFQDPVIWKTVTRLQPQFAADWAKDFFLTYLKIQ